ncbi:hypothetical protein BpHYR1_042433 [Brachionus plicatilis]|uniref:STPR domain-containing protein n=1 Tax=Brachionus plicatilis TaxID=10195 RepID=A0A3M7QXH6_BRAPC|nr:hypothetical protein BpHYR1_042433 [Brachionus plicatilis]
MQATASENMDIKHPRTSAAFFGIEVVRNDEELMKNIVLWFIIRVDNSIDSSNRTQRNLTERTRRADESSEKRSNRLNTEAQRQREKRTNETPKEREKRLKYNRNYEAKVQEIETSEERMQHLGLVNERRRKIRNNRATYMEWTIPRQTAVEIDDQGPLNQYCEILMCLKKS